MQKKLQVTHRQIFHKKSNLKGYWSDFLLVEPDPSLLLRKGKLYIMASLRGRWNIQGKKILKQFFQNLEEYYYKNPKDNVLDNLEKGVKFSHHQMLKQFRVNLNDGTFFNALAFVVWGNVLYLAQAGSAKGVLFRNGEKQILGADNPEEIKDELFSNTIHVSSGLMKENDLLVLGLNSFWENLDLNKLSFWLEKKDLEEVEKNILKTFVEKDIDFASGLIFDFKVAFLPSEKEVIKIAIPPSEEPGKIKKILTQTKEFILSQKELIKNKALTIKLKKEEETTSNKEPFKISQILSLEPSSKKEESSETEISPTEEIFLSEFGKEKEIEKAALPTEISSPSSFETEIIPENEPIKTQEIEEELSDDRRLKPQDPSLWWNFKNSLAHFSSRLFKTLLKKFKIFFSRAKRSVKIIIPSKEEKQLVEEKRNQEISNIKDPSFYLNQTKLGRFFSKKGFFLIAGLIIILGVSLFFTNKWRNQNTLDKENQTLYEETLAKLEESQRISFSEADKKRVYNETLETIQTLKDREFDSQKISEIETKQRDLEDLLYNVVRLKEPKVLADFNLKIENSKSDKTTIIGNYLYSLSEINQFVFALNLDDGEVEYYPLPEESIFSNLWKAGDSLYLYSSEGIYLLTANKEFKLTIEKDEDWQTVVDMADYYGNLYLLDSQAKQIWKYVPTNNGFNIGTAYLTNIPDPEFSEAQSLAVDGTIFVLVAGRDLWQFSQGQRQSFTIAGLDQSLNGATTVYTEESFTNLYLLDPGNKRVVILNKEGLYQKQYLIEEASSLDSLMVNSGETKLFLSSGSEIWEISL